MNKTQDLIQFEFYNADSSDPFIVELMTSKRQPVIRERLRSMLPEFQRRLHAGLAENCNTFGLLEGVPERFVIISQCRFDDNYYSIREGSCSVLALGNWRRYMAPPSLVEFIQVLLVREAVAILCPSLSGSVHLGNKSCLMDFTQDLSEARQKVIAGYICHFCSSCMISDNQSELTDVVSRLTDRKWLGSPADPRSPAGVAANLGYDLFIVKGLRATARERFVATLQEEGAKQIAVAVGVILAAAVLFLLGIKAAG
jgi:hypothetical protein